MKRDYNKMISEYEAAKAVSGFYSFQDIADMVAAAEEKYTDGTVYLVKAHPSNIAWYAFRLGYVAALRKMKSQAKKQAGA